jgi:hypothetical protein
MLIDEVPSYKQKAKENENTFMSSIPSNIG